MTELSLEAEISVKAVSQRLDQALAELFPDYSRSRIQQWIKNGDVTIDEQKITKPRQKVQGGEMVSIHAELETVIPWQGEDLPINIVYEDDDLIILNKAAGMVVHPAAGNWSGTLLNALLHHDPQLDQLPRAGIVHRLDKDTTGLMVVAKSLKAHTYLVNELQLRNINRQYLCIVNGMITAGGTVEQPIGRHPVRRKQMAVVDAGKPAITHYRVEEKLNHYCLLRVKLETGRTHQIRVHMSWLKHPLVGDPLYGGRMRLPSGATDRCIQTLRGFERQALHATELGFTHPSTKETMRWKAPIPEDMEALLSVLREEGA